MYDAMDAMRSCAAARGLVFVSRPLAHTSWLSRYALSGNLTPSAQANMHDGIFKQSIQPFDRLYRTVSLRHRHSLYSFISTSPTGSVPLGLLSITDIRH